MTFLGSLDGSTLASAALERATTIGAATETAVVALTVVPDDRAPVANDPGDDVSVVRSAE